MAKKAYVGINDVARNISKMYVGVNGIARKVIKGYIGVNGIAKQFWGDSSSSNDGFWFNYSTVAEKVMQGKRYTVVPNQVQVDIYKVNSGIAFYFFVQPMEGGSIIDNWTVLISPQNTVSYYNAVCQGQTENYNAPYSGSLAEQGDVWYYTLASPIEYDYEPQYPADIIPNCVLHETVSILSNFLNNHIYADDFAEDYQVGQTYNLRVGNIEKTVRKALAVFLYKNASAWYNKAAYTSMLRNLETIVNYILTDKGNHDKMYIRIYSNSSDTLSIIVYYSSGSVNSKEVREQSVAGGYTTYRYYPYIQYDYYTLITFASDGNISHTAQSYTPYNMTNIIGTSIVNQSGSTVQEVGLSNIGITFSGMTSLIPIMTSNTTPSGTISGSNIVGCSGNIYDASMRYYAFNSDTNTYVTYQGEDVTGYIQYDFDSPVSFEMVVVTACKIAMYTPHNENFTVEVYYGGSWHTYGTFVITEDNGTNYVWKNYTISNSVNNVTSIRVNSTTQKIYGYNIAIANIQVYKMN